MDDTKADQHMTWDRLFRWATVFFAFALALHGADHVRRGMDAVPPAVMVAGMTQLVLGAVAVVLVFLGSRWSPHLAIALGFLSAIGFTAAHLLPAWGFFSDSYINAPPAARVTMFSWITAIVEIGADIVFGLVGIAALRGRQARSYSQSAAARAAR
jgi:hypothetical protein